MPSKALLHVIFKIHFTEEKAEALRGYVNFQGHKVTKKLERKLNSDLTAESCILSRLPEISLVSPKSKWNNHKIFELHKM